MKATNNTSSRDSFVFYRSFQDSIDNLADSEQLIIYKAIANYALNAEEPSLKGYLQSIFMLIKPVLDANNKRWQNGKKGAEHGKKGGRPKNETKTPDKPQENPILTPNKDVDVDVNKDEEYLSTNVDCDNSELSPIKISYQKVVSLYHSICVSYQRVQKLTDYRKSKIKTRINEIRKSYPQEDYLNILKQVFTNLQASDFLKGVGSGDSKWQANFDWVFKNGKNWLNIYEGAYKNRQEGGSNESKIYKIDE